MKVVELKLILANVASFSREAGALPIADQIDGMAGLLPATDRLTVVQMIALLRREPIATVALELRKAKSILVRVKDVLLAANARAAATDFERLISAASQPSDQTRPRQPTPIIQNMTLNKDLVDRYVLRLKEAMDNNAEYDKLISDLKKNKSIRLGEMKEIAVGFIGRKIPSKFTKSMALREIVEHQALDARQKARSR